MSYTFTLSDRSSVLTAQIYPPIILKENQDYVLGLVNFESFNSIPNVDSTNNKFHFNKNEVITIPEGSYEITDINNYLVEQVANVLKEKPGTDNEKPFLSIKANYNTLKCEIKSNLDIDFSKNHSIASLLGFKKKKLIKNKKHIPDNPIDIFKVNTICVKCNLVTNSFNNGNSVHIIHMFYPSSVPGTKIIERPSNVIYLPINTRYIDTITLKITDQNGNIINFRQEVITVRLHLQRTSLNN